MKSLAKLVAILPAVLAAIAVLTTPKPARAGGVEKILTLTAAGSTSGPFGHSGQMGSVTIEVHGGKTELDFSLTGLTPNAVHGVWLILDTGSAPYIGTCAGPLCTAQDSLTGTTASVFPFTPAAPDNAGFTAGNGLDPNGFLTDASGNAKFEIDLDYDIFQTGVAPVVLNPGLTQTIAVTPSAPGDPPNCTGGSGSLAVKIDSGYMRVYNTSTVASLPGTSPSFQVLDSALKPRLVRGTVVRITLIEHFDGVTHGHLPGLHVGSPAASCGDWEGRLTGKLADAVPED